MLLHYFMGKFQAVKPVTEHTRGCVRADRAQWSQRGAGMLLRSSPLLFPHPEGRAVPSLLRLTWSLPFLAEEISVPTSLRMRAGHPLKKAGPQHQELQQPLQPLAQTQSLPTALITQSLGQISWGKSCFVGIKGNRPTLNLPSAWMAGCIPACTR